MKNFNCNMPSNSIFGTFGPNANHTLKPLSDLIEIARLPNLVLFSGPKTRILSSTTNGEGPYAWLWGSTGVRGVNPSELANWCLDKVTSGNNSALRDLPGAWLLVVYEPELCRMFIVTDLIGMQPVFVFEKEDGLYFGSDAWSMLDMGWITAKLNYDAIASWLSYYYNITDHALFADIRRPSPATIECYPLTGAKSIITYGMPRIIAPPDSDEEYVERYHGAVMNSLHALTDGVHNIVCALSGGFDTRYLLACYLKYVGGNARAFIVDAGEDELLPAKEAANRLNVPLEIIHPGALGKTGSEWDLFDEPYISLPDGFPITKQFTLFAAQNSQGAPLLSGFLGDPLMRGTRSQCCGLFEYQCQGKIVETAYREHDVMSWWWYLFDDEIAQSAQHRSISALDTLMQGSRESGYPFRFADLYGRQRLYISNNVTQCLNDTDILQPFLNADLIDLRFSVGDKLPTMQIYRKIFQRYLPEISDIPHSSEIPKGKQSQPRLGKTDRNWAYFLILELLLNRQPKSIKRLKSVRSILSCLTVSPNLHLAVEHLYRTQLLESCFKSRGLELDWQQMKI